MQEERKMILKMIDDGKITAEEGLALLKQLGDTERPKEQEQTNHLSTNVNWEHDDDYRGNYKQQSFTHRFTEFIDVAVQKIKELDLDFNFGQAVEVDHVFQHRDTKVTKVEIAVENGSIQFFPWDESDVRVECRAKVYRKKEGEEARNYFLAEVLFDVTDGKLRFKSREKTVKVNANVYVPRAAYDTISLYTFNGQLNGETLEAREFEAKTVNGRISFETLLCKKATLETVQGSITVAKLAAEKSEAKTVNGTIRIDSQGGEVDIETLNGKIKYQLIEPIKAKAFMKTTTGSIEITVPPTMQTEGEFKSVVGGFTCNLPMLQVFDEKKDLVNKSVSFISNKGAEPVFYVEAEARTGSITIQN